MEERTTRKKKTYLDEEVLKTERFSMYWQKPKAQDVSRTLCFCQQIYLKEETQTFRYELSLAFKQ